MAKTIHVHKKAVNADGNQNYVGEKGNQTLDGLNGKNDHYDGKGGKGDKLVIDANWADAKITKDGNEFIIKVGHDKITVKNVEKFVFNDGTLNKEQLINDAPKGTPTPIAAHGTEDTAFTVTAADLLAGLSDKDKDTLSVTGTVTADHGTVVANPDGSYTVTPAADYNGVVTLSYTVSDGRGGTLAATNTVTVDAVNDAPTGTPTALPPGTEDAVVSVTTAQLTAGLTDKDGDTLTVSGLTADHGTVTTNPDGSFSITPEADYNGPVTLSYTVSDGHGGTLVTTDTVTLAAANDAPTGTSTATLAAGTEDKAYTVSASDLLQGFSDKDGDKLSVADLAASNGATVTANPDGTYTITPAPNYNGDVTLTFNVIDSNGGSIAGTNKVNFVDVPESFTLTTATDTPALTAGADVVSGVVSALSSENTLNPLDVIVDAGGTDTLKVNLKSDFGGFTGTGKMTGVENVELTNSTTTTRTFTATGTTGIAQYTLTGAVNLAGQTSIASVVAGTRQVDLSLGYAAATTVGTADALSLSITDFGTKEDDTTVATEEVIVGIAATGIETTNLTVSGTDVITLTGLASKTVNVAGAGSVDIKALNAATTSFDGSAATGAITVDTTGVTGNALTNVKTGAGDDTIVIDLTNQLAINATVAGGAGADTLVVTGGIGGTTQYSQSGIETIAVGAAGGDIIMSLTKTTDVAKYVVYGSDNTTYGTMSNSATFVGTGSGAVTVELTGANANAGAEAISVDASGSATIVVDSPVTGSTNIAPSVNNYNVTLNNAATVALTVASAEQYTGVISAAKATSVTAAINGSLDGATITAAAATSVVISAVDNDSSVVLTTPNVTELQISNLKALDIDATSTLGAVQALTSSGTGDLDFNTAALTALNTATITNTGAVTLYNVGSGAQDYDLTVSSTGSKSFGIGTMTTLNHAIGLTVADSLGAISVDDIDAGTGAVTVTESGISTTGFQEITGGNVSVNVSNVTGSATFGDVINASGNVTIVGNATTGLSLTTGGANDIHLTGTGAHAVSLTSGIASDAFDIVDDGNGGTTGSTSITVSGDLGFITGNADVVTVTALNASTTGTIISLSGLANYSASTVIGTVSADTITGGASADDITGDGGADKLAGGAGSDHFIYLAATDSTGTAVATLDFISDLNLGTNALGGQVDVLEFTNTGGSESVYTLTTADQATVTAAADLSAAATAAAAAGAGTDGETIEFAYGGNTYIFHNTAADSTYDSGTDYLVKVNGVTGVLDASDIVIL